MGSIGMCLWCTTCGAEFLHSARRAAALSPPAGRRCASRENGALTASPSCRPLAPRSSEEDTFLGRHASLRTAPSSMVGFEPPPDESPKGHSAAVGRVETRLTPPLPAAPENKPTHDPRHASCKQSSSSPGVKAAEQTGLYCHLLGSSARVCPSVGASAISGKTSKR